MFRNTFAGAMMGAVVVTMLCAQSSAPAQDAPGGGRQRGGGRAGGGGQAGGRGTSHYPTAEQWAAMPPGAKEYVEKAKALAGNDADLQFDFGIFCASGGGASNQERATIGVPTFKY